MSETQMSETLALMLSVAAGGALGVIFYGGLWWTVSRGLPSQVPGIWFFGSLVLRMSLVVAGFYFVSRGHWDRMLLCLLGFVIARLIVTRLTRGSKEARREVGHAPEF